MTITSVWSCHGHRFIGTDTPEQDSCLTCGAMYSLVPDADSPSSGTYMAANGDEPNQCSGDTSHVHGYPGEREDGDNHDCNCLFCR